MEQWIVINNKIKLGKLIGKRFINGLIIIVSDFCYFGVIGIGIGLFYMFFPFFHTFPLSFQGCTPPFQSFIPSFQGIK
jgi:hypothetical protein